MKRYGDDLVLDYAAAPFENSMKDVDAVLDTVGWWSATALLRCTETGWSAGCDQPTAIRGKAKKHHVKASMMVTETSTSSLQTMAAMIDAGAIQPFVSKVYPLSEVPRVWRDVPSKNFEGKTVFAVSG
jgi:NADPH:quinone reductase-like Zn-dependent oxidoreductase